MAKLNLNQQAKEIIRIAEESGVQSNFFFITTFKRYQVQLNILNELEQNHPLLIFISKNLSWGMFRGILDREIQEEEDPYGSAFPDILQQAEMKYRDPELMLFSILELVGSACYSCILFQQPVPLSSYKPDLYHTIRAILSAHEYK